MDDQEEESKLLDIEDETINEDFTNTVKEKLNTSLNQEKRTNSVPAAGKKRPGRQSKMEKLSSSLTNHSNDNKLGMRRHASMLSTDG